ncbi:hypothetical protein FOZ62_000022 [Perkinsus olseni]|uniref:subtilisin n=1 Tax=Perkinsus olseni TaxID=32597 RepID=A0A7J6PTI7_PEROL|nr:hypothetical protein FOZ62_000022 [Perkinsus olseni]
MSERRLWFSRSGASTREFGPSRQSILDYPPNDPLFSSQETLFKALQIEDTWQAMKSSGLPRKAVVLTVIDTGITPGHPELEGRLLKEREAETYTKRSNAWGTGHGMMMAGIIASNINNMVGLAGIADKVKIRSISMKPCGLGDVSITQSLLAFEKALEMKETSVVVYAYGNRFTPVTSLIFDYILKKVTKKGILVLVSSSNSDRVDSREEVIIPCSLANGIPGVLCVAATQAEEPLVLARKAARLASLGVPGTEVMSLTPERDGDEWLYGMFRGSSSATAAAGGIVALMKSLKAFKPEDVERMLLNATEGRVKTEDGDEMTYGVLRPHLAVEQAIAEELREQADEDMRHLQSEFRRQMGEKAVEIEALEEELKALREGRENLGVSPDGQQAVLEEMVRLQEQATEAERRSAELGKQVVALQNTVDAERQEAAEERSRFEESMRASEETNRQLNDELQRDREILSQLEEATDHRSNLAVDRMQEDIQEKDRTIKALEAALASSRDDLKLLEARVGNLMNLVKEEREGAERKAAEGNVGSVIVVAMVRKFKVEIRKVRRSSENTVTVLRSKIQKMEAAHAEAVESYEGQITALKAESSKIRARLNKVRASTEAKEGRFNHLVDQLEIHRAKAAEAREEFLEERRRNKELNRRLAAMEQEASRRMATAELGSKALEQRLRQLGERRASLASAESLAEEVEDLRLKYVIAARTLIVPRVLVVKDLLI